MRGYEPISDINECIRNSMECADSAEFAEENLHSILLPLMGTGTTNLSAQGIANQLISTAIAYIEENPQSKIENIYFLAYNEQDLDICRHFFLNDSRIASDKGRV